MDHIVDLDDFIADRKHYLLDSAEDDDNVEFGSPSVHFESVEPVGPNFRDWRAELRLWPRNERDDAPHVAAGYVDFLVVRLGLADVAYSLRFLLGVSDGEFAELYQGAGLEPGLGENDDVTGGMPIDLVLHIVRAYVDPSLSDAQRLRAWMIAEVVDTMLPTTTGLVVMHAVPSVSFLGRLDPVSLHLDRGLVAADTLDQDWPLVGCAPLPGHPRFCGRATSYRFLEDARAALADMSDQGFFVSTE